MIQRITGAALPLSLLLFATPATAQQEDPDTLPVSALPLADAPPAVAFVAYLRERGPAPRKDWSDMQITLWEIDPNRKKEAAVRRRVLGRSHWNVTPLLDSPDVLRWQVPSNERGYAVKLLRVDYATFTVKELLHIKQAHAFGRCGSQTFLNTSEGQCLFDLKTGARTERTPPIRLLRQLDNDWLVVVDGQLARFDASKNEIVRRYDKIAVGKRERAYVHWDGGRFAVTYGGFVDAAGKRVHSLDFGKPGIVYRELRIWNLQKGDERKLRVRMQARGGSGIGVIPTAMHTELNGPMLRYTERVPLGEHDDLAAFEWHRDTQWVTIEIATGKEMLREPSDAHQPTPTVAKVDVPEYLREGFEQSPIGAWGAEQDLAYAFLDHKGAVPKFPRTGVTKLGAVCRSPDGEQLLVMHDGQFYLGNLKTQTLQQFAAPASWGQAIVELHAVSVH